MIRVLSAVVIVTVLGTSALSAQGQVLVEKNVSLQLALTKIGRAHV